MGSTEESDALSTAKNKSMTNCFTRRIRTTSNLPWSILLKDRWLMEELNCIDNQLYPNRLYLQLTDSILWAVMWWRKLRKPQGLSLSTQRRLQKKKSFPGFMSKCFDVLGSSLSLWVYLFCTRSKTTRRQVRLKGNIIYICGLIKFSKGPQVSPSW